MLHGNISLTNIDKYLTNINSYLINTKNHFFKVSVISVKYWFTQNST